MVSGDRRGGGGGVLEPKKIQEVGSVFLGQNFSLAVKFLDQRKIQEPFPNFDKDMGKNEEKGKNGRNIVILA